MTGSGSPQREVVDGLDVAVGTRLRRRREELAWSQQKVADVLLQRFGLNWHQTTVGKVESGERPLKLSEALALAYTLFLSSTLDELLHDDPHDWAQSAMLEGAEVELALLGQHLDTRRQELRALQREVDENGEADGEHR